MFEGAAARAAARGRDGRPRPSLIAVETLVFGRLAMGETRIDARLSDSWRLRRDGRLVFADETRLDACRRERSTARRAARARGRSRRSSPRRPISRRACPICGRRSTPTAARSKPAPAPSTASSSRASSRPRRADCARPRSRPLSRWADASRRGCGDEARGAKRIHVRGRDGAPGRVGGTTARATRDGS